MASKARRKGLKTKMIWGSSLLADEVGPMIYERFPPAALAQKLFVPAPEPHWSGTGWSIYQRRSSGSVAAFQPASWW